MTFFRHELKYAVTTAQIACLRSRISSFTVLDPHVRERGIYNIRSLYFDDYKDTCFYDNENGTSPREKFRIRIYNGSAEEIRLELKRKEQGMTHKEACALSKEQCMAVFSGKTLSFGEEDAAVFKKFCLQQKNRLLRPKVIVEYEREPYVYQGGNVRITFDTDIRSSCDLSGFFNKKIIARPVMPRGLHLLEVKYDEYLPDYLYRALQMENLQLTTFSKYYLCRKYNMGGIINHGL